MNGGKFLITVLSFILVSLILIFLITSNTEPDKSPSTIIEVQPLHTQNITQAQVESFKINSFYSVTVTLEFNTTTNTTITIQTTGINMYLNYTKPENATITDISLNKYGYKAITIKPTSKKFKIKITVNSGDMIVGYKQYNILQITAITEKIKEDYAVVVKL